MCFVYPLTGKSLKIGKHRIRLGIPDICLLQPAERLRSRIVIIKGYAEPEGFLAVAKRQLEKLGIQGTASIATKADGKPKRRTIKVHNSTLVGFSLNVTNLSNDDSLVKRKMGCGLFVPTKEQLTNN